MYSVTLTFANVPEKGLQLQISGTGSNTVAIEQIAACVAIESTKAGMAALHEMRRQGAPLPDPRALIDLIHTEAAKQVNPDN